MFRVFIQWLAAMVMVALWLPGLPLAQAQGTGTSTPTATPTSTATATSTPTRTLTPTVTLTPTFMYRALSVCCTPSSNAFTANLSGAEEVPPVSTSATGTFTGQLGSDGTTLSFTLTTTGLPLDLVTAAHIHSPAPPGVNAPIRVTLFEAPGGTQGPGGGFTSPFTGVVTIPADVLSDIRNGNAYVNVHTTRALC